MTALILSLLIHSTSHANQLNGLKPKRQDGAAVGHMTARLRTSGKLVGLAKRVLGDCSDCVRGVAMKGVIGVRFEGDTVERLTIARKQSSSVDARNCTQTQFDQAGLYKCEFKADGRRYELTVTIE